MTTKVPAAPLAAACVTAGEEPTGLGVSVGTGVGLMLSPLKNPLLPLQPFKPLIEPVAEPSLARVRVPNKVRFAAGRFDPLPRGVADADALGFDDGDELGLLEGDEPGLPEGDELGLLDGDELALLDAAGMASDCARTTSEPANATAVNAAAVSHVPRIVRVFTIILLRFDVNFGSANFKHLGNSRWIR